MLVRLGKAIRIEGCLTRPLLWHLAQPRYPNKGALEAPVLALLTPLLCQDYAHARVRLLAAQQESACGQHRGPLSVNDTVSQK